MDVGLAPVVDQAPGRHKRGHSHAEGLERRHAGAGSADEAGTGDEGDGTGAEGGDGAPSEEEGQQDQVEAAMVVNDPLAPLESAPRDRWYNAAVPFLVVAVSTFVGMILDGRGACHRRGVPASVINIFTLANSFNALLWGSLFGCIVALVLVLAQRIMTIGTAMEVCSLPAARRPRLRVTPPPRPHV